MKDVLRLRATFLFSRAFRVGTGEADAGVDDRVDPDEPLPETTVKNRLRTAALAAGLPAAAVREVFGSPEGGCPWNFTVRQPTVVVQPVPSVHLGEGRAAEPTGLRSIEVATGAAGEAGQAVVLVSQIRLLSDEHRLRHVLALLVAARFCKTLGGDRNRGLGSVDIRLDHCRLPGVTERGLAAQLAAVSDWLPELA